MVLRRILRSPEPAAARWRFDDNKWFLSVEDLAEFGYSIVGRHMTSTNQWVAALKKLHFIRRSRCTYHFFSLSFLPQSGEVGFNASPKAEHTSTVYDGPSPAPPVGSCFPTVPSATRRGNRKRLPRIRDVEARSVWETMRPTAMQWKKQKVAAQQTQVAVQDAAEQQHYNHNTNNTAALQLPQVQTPPSLPPLTAARLLTTPPPPEALPPPPASWLSAENAPDGPIAPDLLTLSLEMPLDHHDDMLLCDDDMLWDGGMLCDGDGHLASLGSLDGSDASFMHSCFTGSPPPEQQWQGMEGYQDRRLASVDAWPVW